MNHGRRNGQRHASAAWQAEGSEDGQAMQAAQGGAVWQLVELACAALLLANWMVGLRDECRASRARVISSDD